MYKINIIMLVMVTFCANASEHSSTSLPSLKSDAAQQHTPSLGSGTQTDFKKECLEENKAGVGACGALASSDHSVVTNKSCKHVDFNDPDLKNCTIQ